MNEEQEIIESNDTSNTARPSVNRKPIYIAAGIAGVLILSAIAIWFWRGRETGQVVPAPRNVSFDNNTSGQPSDSNGDQTLTIPPEQVERAGIKIETVGETLSSEAANVSSTGVIQSNAYGETPVISLLGGVVRRVNAELGQNVGRGRPSRSFSATILQQPNRVISCSKPSLKLRERPTTAPQSSPI